MERLGPSDFTSRRDDSLQHVSPPESHSVGANVIPGKGVHFRVWAPKRSTVEVVFEPRDTHSFTDGSKLQIHRSIQLTPASNGYFEGAIAEASAGMLYRYRLDQDGLFPDPASRFQPFGPHGPSEIIDPSQFRWTDKNWRGIPPERRIIYELHLGTFTPEGTWTAALEQIPELVTLGITVIQVMPLHDFVGEFGWGYDGVNFFAPTRLYGRPDDARRFVNKAHEAGIAVILDVVYNHVGSDGNYLPQFSDSYEPQTRVNEWGGAINFDEAESAPVRNFFIQNAKYWIEEFHFDGLRLDATQEIHDRSPVHIVRAIGEAVRAAALAPHSFIVAENEPQDVYLVERRERGGCELDAIVNDDFHHSARVAVTGKSEAYYSDYRGTPQELLSAIKWGFLFQGQRYRWQEDRRGTSALGFPPTAFVTCLQNHDQVANSATGARLHELTSPGRLRTITALMLLAPPTPMLFQGQEFGSSKRFLYFANPKAELVKSVQDGRGKFLSQFPSIAEPSTFAMLADPCARETFTQCKLDFSERVTNEAILRLHADLIRMRLSDPVFSCSTTIPIDGAVIAERCFILRWISSGNDRLMIVNLGSSLELPSIPEPLIAPPANSAWRVHWSSEDPAYSGAGTPEIETDNQWSIPGEAAVVLIPQPREKANASTMDA